MKRRGQGWSNVQDSPSREKSQPQQRVSNDQNDAKASSISFPVRVGTAFQVYHIFNISEADGEFSCTFSLHMEWKDESLIGHTTFDKAKDWSPVVIFHNNVTDVKVLYSTLTVVNSETGEVTWDSQYRGRFHTEMELQTFPFDRQSLLIKAATIMPHDKVQFVPHSSRENKMLAPALPEWLLLDNDVQEPSAHFAHVTSSAGISFDQYIVCIFIQRRYQYYLWNVVFVMFLIGSMAGLSFTVPVQQTWDRLAVTLTLVLTAMAFKYVVAEKMPRLSYLTYLDKYMSLSFFFLFIIAVENGVTKYFSKGLRPQIEFWAFCVLYATWAIVHMAAFLMPMTGWIYPGWGESTKMKVLKKNESDHEQYMAKHFGTRTPLLRDDIDRENTRTLETNKVIPINNNDLLESFHGVST